MFEKISWLHATAEADQKWAEPLEFFGTGLQTFKTSTWFHPAILELLEMTAKDHPLIQGPIALLLAVVSMSMDGFSYLTPWGRYPDMKNKPMHLISKKYL